MSEVNDTDLFLLQRNGKSHQIQAQNLMAEIQPTDLMLINRASKSYRVTGQEVKDSLGGNSAINPQPGDWNISPAPQGGNGTEGSPFVLQRVDITLPTNQCQTVETLSLTGLEEDSLIKWFDHTTGAGNRFFQEPDLVPPSGSYSYRLKFADSPTTSSDTVYQGKLQLGSTWFRWDVGITTTVAPDLAGINIIDDPSPGRFTNQNFQAVITMNAEGVPVSDKVLKGRITGELYVMPGATIVEVAETTDNTLNATITGDTNTQYYPTPEWQIFTDSGNFLDGYGTRPVGRRGCTGLGIGWNNNGNQTTEANYRLTLEWPAPISFDTLVMHHGSLGGLSPYPSRNENMLWVDGTNYPNVGIGNRSNPPEYICDKLGNLRVYAYENYHDTVQKIEVRGSGFCLDYIYIDGAPLGKKYKVCKVNGTLSQFPDLKGVHKGTCYGEINLWNEDKSVSAQSVCMREVDGQVWFYIASETNGTFEVGDTIKLDRRQVADTTAYLKLDNDGKVDDALTYDPGWKNVSLVQDGLTHTGTISFPSLMPSGFAPDVDFPEGSRLTMSCRVSNVAGSEEDENGHTPS